MESVVTEGLIDQLVAAIGRGDIGVIVGVALIILSGLAVLITRDRLAEGPTEWISASTAVASGIGLLLTSGRLWYEAVLLGLFAAPASRGFWALFGRLIPKRPAGGAAVLLVLVVPALSGCPRGPQIARDALEGLGALTVATDEVLVVAQAQALQKAQDVTLEQYEEEMAAYRTCLKAKRDIDLCPDPGEPEEYIENYDERVAGWRKAATGLRELQEGISDADDIVRRWRDAGTDNPPGTLKAACVTIRITGENVIEGLELAGQTVPDQLTAGMALVEPACEMVGGWVLETREKGELKC